MTTGTEVETITVALAKPKRRMVEHLFWKSNMKANFEMDVDMRSLCGVWTSPGHDGEDEETYVQVVGALIPLPEPEDCKRCLRALEAHYRRRWERWSR